MSILSKFFGDSTERQLKPLRARVDEINALEPEFTGLADDELRDLTRQFKHRLANGETLDDMLPDAFAVVREAARRTLGQRHFDVQLIGGMALHESGIAEMKTGEGKTLVATLPLYLNSLEGKGVHLVTPNDYLSRIGAGWMGPVYHILGVSVAVLAHEFSGVYDPAYTDSTPHGDDRLSHFRSCTRREAYSADITYGTNNEFGFDYLRDNLEQTPLSLRQRKHHFAIVDEIDSILIDEARTPLIISVPDEESADLYNVFARLVPRLKEGADYNIDEKMHSVAITEEGIDKVEKILGVENIYEEKGIRFVRHLESSLRAQALFHHDKEYVVRDGKVIIVDEFTGRLMPGRRWSEGLHQAIEAKEGVAVERESRTLATITFQNYFRMYRKLAGMTGTAQTSAEEFHKVYNLDVIPIPTHRPMIREDFPDLVFRTERGKFQALVREIKERHSRGQPVLVGTVSIERNERLSKMLHVEGVPHNVLNAKNHEREAMIIAQAGRKGAVTVATNMAGRGVDIILGGTPSDPKDAGDVRARGGLYVIGTERHEARRIDNQLRGRAGRQGDAGTSRFYVSFEDELMRVFGSTKIKSLMETMGIAEDQPIEHRMISRAIESAQTKIEGFHFDTRKHVLEFDDVLNKQRDAIYRMRHAILLFGYEKTEEFDAAALKRQIMEMLDEQLERAIDAHAASSDPKEWNTEELFEICKAMWGSSDSLHVEFQTIRNGDDGTEEKRLKLLETTTSAMRRAYDEREERIGEHMREMERAVMLRSIDMLWMDHLDQMEHLRDSVRLRAYGQREPLVEYKNEGSRLFHELQTAIRAQIANTIFKVEVTPAHEHHRHVELRRPDTTPPNTPQPQSSSHTHVPLSPNERSHPILDKEQAAGSEPVAAKPEVGRPTFAEATVGRNDPCPCGSGKKYKRCHGA